MLSTADAAKDDSVAPVELAVRAVTAAGVLDRNNFDRVPKIPMLKQKVRAKNVGALVSESVRQSLRS